MSITVEQIVQTLESLAPSENIYGICYYTNGIQFRINIRKYNSTVYKIKEAWFDSRSMVEFAAIREGRHYVDYCRQSFIFRRDTSFVCPRFLALQITCFLEDCKCHRMIHYVTERLRLQRGPIKKRGESVIEAEVRFYEQKLNETHEIQNFHIPVELKTMVLDYSADTDSDTEEYAMHNAKQVILFHSLHGQFPEA